MVLDLRVLSRQVIQHISYFNWNSCRTANLLHFEFILIKHWSYEYHQHAIIFQIHHLLSLTIFPLQFTGIARKLTCRIYSRNSYINSPGQHMKYSPNQVNHLKARQVNKNIKDIIRINQGYVKNKNIKGFALNLLICSK